MSVYLIHCIRSLLTYSVLTLTPVKMWFAPEVCNKTVHLVTPAVLKKLNMSSSNSKQKIVSLLISWSMILFCSDAVSLFIRQVWTGPHITFFNFSFSLIRSVAQWYKHAIFFFSILIFCWCDGRLTIACLGWSKGAGLPYERSWQDREKWDTHILNAQWRKFSYWRCMRFVSLETWKNFLGKVDQ